MYVYYIIFKFLYLIIIYVFTINTTKSINSTNRTKVGIVIIVALI